MSQLDLRLLRYFVAVAENEHVGQAAERLNISQSPLSRQLKLLEKELGLELFLRQGKRLRLSEHGRRFLPEAVKILKEAKRIERYAARLARGESARISIGYVRNAFWNGLLPQSISRFRARHPHVDIDLQNSNSSVQTQMLLRREIDIGFVHWPTAGRQFETRCVSRERMKLAMPAAHPFRARAALAPSDLHQTPWIALERRFDPGAHDALLAVCAKADFRPDIRYETTDLPMSLNLVAAGLGCSFVPGGVPNPHPSLVEIREIPWLGLELLIFMIRLREHPRPELGDFVRSVLRRH